ncbi:PREDICTED: reticulocalbin-2 [Nicrophorus vespilloides]|uniref:Reticulocalbin-2 n=1 Tax=Nicrophorus vespilloides TaxID=110193 RepID=A0ABM1M5H2_NICVS|nr:PREDICTED: reticulocalbin-2 [Nicrophorus vespilloides]
MRTLLVVFAFVSSLSYCMNAAVVHQHSANMHKERLEDGAYSPRDRGHLSDSGEHDSDFDHEAILGSSKVAEEFEHLTKDESIRRLRILLKNMDLNKDQNIDRRELKSWIMRSFRMLSEEEAQERMEDADENEDGKVTWKEYISDAFGSDETGENLDNAHLMESDRIMWMAADANMDNILEGDEWIAFSHPEEHPAMLPVILNQTLKEKDTDRDGSISFQEFIGDRGVHRDTDWLLVEKQKFDHDFDKDKDGKLDGSEILSWVVPSNEEIAQEEVDHLFASSDDDHDDLLSFDEVIEHHDIFVGSEATDYGEHIHNIHQFQDEL